MSGIQLFLIDLKTRAVLTDFPTAIYVPGRRFVGLVIIRKSIMVIYPFVDNFVSSFSTYLTVTLNNKSLRGTALHGFITMKAMQRNVPKRLAHFQYREIMLRGRRYFAFELLTFYNLFKSVVEFILMSFCSCILLVKCTF